LWGDEVILPKTGEEPLLFNITNNVIVQRTIDTSMIKYHLVHFYIQDLFKKGGIVE
jgi:hypothetical protein